MEPNTIIDSAVDEAVEEIGEPQSLESFVEQLLDEPELASPSAEYVVRAIEHFGTRTVVEAGEELQRYRFFDDPANGGEHAVLGHTEMLNEFVDDLRQQAEGSAQDATVFWFTGGTATGKSELKRCLINGLREYSKTEEGRRYTIEWTNETPDNVRYIDSGAVGRTAESVEVEDDDWYMSPVQANPVTVLPRDTREQVLDDADVTNAEELAKVGTDPFSKTVYDDIVAEYGRDKEAHETVLSDDHCRVVPYTMDVGRGIGVLQSEDHGRAKEKLAGQWMRGMVERLDSRGRKDPRAFSYDGVVSQGNAGLSVIEDAGQHFEMLTQLLNVVDDDVVKLDRRTQLPLDTTFILLSNPDLEAALHQQAKGSDDPLRALRRRMERYGLDYLVTPSLAVELLHRELGGRTDVWNGEEPIRQPLHVGGTEFAPHTLHAVALLEVVSRLGEPKRRGMDRVHVARLLDGETVELEGDEIDPIDEDIESLLVRDDGVGNIPVTYTRNVLVDLIGEEDVVMPKDALGTLFGNRKDATVFDTDDVEAIGEIDTMVDDYIHELQEDDVLTAMLADHKPSEADVEAYVEDLYAWGTDESDEDVDPFDLKHFETEYLGFDDDDYDGMEPSEPVEEFRHDEIINSLSSWLYEHAESEDVDVTDYPFSEMPVFDELLNDHSWSDAEETFEDLDLSQWADPLDGTQTQQVKQETIANMVEMYDYTEESAEKTTDEIVARAAPSTIGGQTLNSVVETIKEEYADTDSEGDN